MAFANPNVSDIIATTIEFRSGDIADNVTGNAALLAYLKAKGKVKPISGGSKILEELSFAENANGSWYSGADLLPISAQDVISAAEFTMAQCAVPVVINGLEQLQNSGKEKILDLIEARLDVAEATMMNLISAGTYSDGTGFGGKQLTGLKAAIPVTDEASQTDTYGGISRQTYAFWRTKSSNLSAGTITAANINTYMNDRWAACTRGKEHPDLIVMDNNMWKLYVAFLQERQRFTEVTTGALGFPQTKYQSADVILDGGIGGDAPADTAFFLNTKYLFLRPHKDRNMVPLNPGRRYAINQDLEAQILAWAGQITVSGSQFQGRLDNA